MKKDKSSRLIKLGFKSIFGHKLFTILTFLLVFLSGTTYTLLESAASSFKGSYNQVISEGKLHDYVIKENFKPTNGSSYKIMGVDSSDTVYAINETNVKANMKVSSDTKNGIISLKVDARTGDYASLENAFIKKKIVFGLSNDGNFNKELEQIKSEVKLYESNIEYKVEKQLATTFSKAIKDNFGNEVDINENRSIAVSADNKSFNLVKYNSDTKINKMKIYDGTDRFTNMMSDTEMVNELSARVHEQGYDINDFSVNKLKGFKYTAKGPTGSSISVVDPSSYQAIISPAYANRVGKRTISTELLTREFNKNPNFMEVAQHDPKYKDQIVWVDKTPYFIIGIGTTPDYAYPIIDQSHPVIDIDNQAVLFVNGRGYERIYDGFRTNQKEDYISLRFKPGVSQSRKNEIISNIETLTHKGEITINGNIIRTPRTGYPQNIKMVTSAWDRNDQILLTQERVMFLKDLKSTISSISIATTTMLIIFVAALIIMVFRMLIGIDRKKLATQMALGYSKWQISAAKAIAAFVVAGIPSILGYLSGFGLQFWFIQHFDNYWTIPTFGSSFSWISLVAIVAVPLVMVWVLIFIVTYITLNKPLTEMLNDSPSQGKLLLAKLISRFKILGVKGRYAVALSARNFGKLFLVTVASTASMTAIIIGSASVGKANVAYNETVQMNNFEFKADLFSPTAEGGLYSTVQETKLKDLYMHETYNADGTFAGPDQNAPHWHVPSVADAQYGMAANAGNASNIVGASQYLHHKLQVKSLLDQEVAGMNPWDIAERLMPDNQKNKADEDGKYIENIMKNRSDISNPTDALQYSLDGHDQFGRKIEHDKRHTPYVISYGDVIVNQRDETYTYIDAVRGDTQHKIIGLKENTKMINIDQDKMNALKAFNNKNAVPILINKYIAEKFDLKVNSTLKYKVKNHFKRNFKNFVEPEVTAQVVGIVEGYDDKGIYTLQSIANKTIGLKNPDGTDSINGFNGVFTPEKNPAILSTLPLYSPSGLWLGTDTIVGDWENVLDRMISNNNIWRYSSEVASNKNEFLRMYSRTPFVGATSSVLWNEISKYTFKNISELSSFIIQLIEFIAITLSVIFTAIIASLLLLSNKKKIAALWTMGYRKQEIAKLFLSTYIIPITIAIALAIPLGIAFLAAMKEFIMGFGNILIPFTLTWWAPFIALAGIGLIFVVSTIFTIMTQKSEEALEAFKGD